MNRFLTAGILLATTSATLAAATVAPVGDAARTLATLEAAGYRHIEDLEFEDGLWQAEATRADGRRVDVVVTPEGNTVLDPLQFERAAPIESVLATLAQAGYGDVRDVERDGALYEVDAHDRQGQAVSVHLSAQDARILSVQAEPRGHDD